MPRQQDLAAAPRFVRDAAAALPLFAALAEERLEVAAFAFLGEDFRLLGLRHSRGRRPDLLGLPIREIARDALAFDAVALLVAHNHPSGDPAPSADDHAATRRLVRALDPLGVRLVDHLILARAGTVSFRALGLL